MSDKEKDKDHNKPDTNPDNIPTPAEMQESLKDLFTKLGGKGVSFSPFMQDVDQKQPDKDEPEDELVDTLESLDEFKSIPREVKAHLDRYVIRQDEAKKALSIAVCDHYNHAKNTWLSILRSLLGCPS